MAIKEHFLWFKSHTPDKLTVGAGISKPDEELQLEGTYRTDITCDKPEDPEPPNGSSIAVDRPNDDSATSSHAPLCQYAMGFLLVLFAFLLVYFDKALPLAMISMFLTIAVMTPRHVQMHRFALAWPFLFYSSLTAFVVLEDVYGAGRFGLLIILLAVYSFLTLPFAIASLFLHNNSDSSKDSSSDDILDDPCSGWSFFVIGCILSTSGALCIVAVVKIKEIPGTQATISALLWIWGVLLCFSGLQSFKLSCGV